MLERYLLKNVLTPLKEVKDELRQFKSKVNNTNNDSSFIKGLVAQASKQPKVAAQFDQSSCQKPTRVTESQMDQTATERDQLCCMNPLMSNEKAQTSMKDFCFRNRTELIGKCLPMDAQLVLAEYFLMQEDKQNEWKNILLVVGRRKRGTNGVLGNFTVAVNMANDKRINLFIESHLIEIQDVN